MSKGDSKLGTFGGVFTPSILTILGVIMYLRLPRVVGQAGLLEAIGIILAAHVISVCTGLSISSIATDKSVGAGGPYYIISRSLGLPIGGTLGLALFIGLSFSVSLYVIGFCESFLAFIDVPATPNAIRICGSLTLAVLTTITFISTSLAIKTQYVILALIVASLVSIFLGSPPPRVDLPETVSGTSGHDLAVLFAIFFPAVTGFTAGVNMSGDLRDPKRAIPFGTMAAIGTGLIVYLALAVFLSVRLSPDQLLRPSILEEVAVWAPAVTAGIWGATLSSALGSILGAPRILQSVSADGITHRWFARGVGRTHEPRNALLLAFFIGWGGILIAELDTIARVVSMVFMATYGFLNAAAAIEGWVSPDFRPGFRIPKMVSVIGALGCLLLMLEMDPVAMFGSTVLLGGLLVFLQRRQLRLESGDAWEGVWSSIVRAGLHRLASGERQHRNWRPNILFFRPDDGEPREALRRTAGSLITGTGMLTEVVLGGARSKRGRRRIEVEDEGPVVGTFAWQVATDAPAETIVSIAQHYGFSGIEPNTVLLDWDAPGCERQGLGALVDRLRVEDVNVLLFSDTTHLPPAGVEPRIDVWWRAGGSPALGVFLSRFLTASAAHRGARLRFLTVTADGTARDGIRGAVRRFLRDARVDAEVEVVLDAIDPRPFEEHVVEHSRDAVLSIVELPSSPLAGKLEAFAEVTRAVPSVLFVASDEGFAALAPSVAPRSDRSGPQRSAVSEEEAPPLPVSAVVQLQPVFDRVCGRYESVTDELLARAFVPLAEEQRATLERVRALVEKPFSNLVEGPKTANPVKRRRLLNRVLSAFLLESEKLVESVSDGLSDQGELLGEHLEALLDNPTLVDLDGVVEIERPTSDFTAAENDPRDVARYKRKRRSGAAGERVTYTLDTRPLQAFFAERLVDDVVDDAVLAHLRDAWELTVEIGRALESTRAALTLIHTRLAEGSDDERSEFISDERRNALDRVDELLLLSEQRLSALRSGVRGRTHSLLRRFLEALDDPLLGLKYKARRHRGGYPGELRERLGGRSEAYYGYQRALLERVRIGLRVSAFQHRLSTIVERASETILIDLRGGVLRSLTDLRAQLSDALGADSEEPYKFEVDTTHRFDPRHVVDSLARDGRASAEKLPEYVDTLSDESIVHLCEGDVEAAKEVELPLRRLASFLLESELIAPLQQRLAELPELEARAVGVAEDVLRLVQFHQRDGEGVNEDASLADQMRPVLTSGIERLDSELEALRKTGPGIRDVLAEHLAAVLRRTNPYELSHAAHWLGHHIRRKQGQRAVAGAQSALRTVLARARDWLAALTYGRSARRVRALSRAGAAAGPTSVGEALRLRERHAPSTSVLADLPFHYRQLFLGKLSFEESFWVGRERETAAARQAIAQHARGADGVLIVTGEPDSGKSTLIQRLATRTLAGRDVVWVTPPEGGSVDLRAFRDRLGAACEAEGTLEELIASLPERTAVVLEEVELWWDRGPDGLAVIDRILELFARHASGRLFVVEIGSHALRVLEELRPMRDSALAVIECGPLPAQGLRDVVMARHTSTGLGLQLEGDGQPEPSAWQLASLFGAYFDRTGGLIGPTLTAWISHVEGVESSVLRVRVPSSEDEERLRLRPGWAAVLVQLALHKRLTRDRLRRVSGPHHADSEVALRGLLRAGLVTESPAGTLRLDRFIEHLVISQLRAEGFLQ